MITIIITTFAAGFLLGAGLTFFWAAYTVGSAFHRPRKEPRYDDPVPDDHAGLDTLSLPFRPYVGISRDHGRVDVRPPYGDPYA